MPRFISYCFVLLFTFGVLGGERTVHDGCFNFDRQIKEALHSPLKEVPNQVTTRSGVLKPGSIPWAAARGTVEVPFSQVYGWLLDHRNWKDMSKTELEVSKTVKAGYLEFHTVDVSVQVFAFVHAEWQEQWAYTLLKGTVEDPREILVSYQKSGGTRHLENLCGSITLRKKEQGKTDIQFYEQTKAVRMDEQDILKMHRDNFRILQTLSSQKAQKSK